MPALICTRGLFLRTSCLLGCAPIPFARVNAQGEGTLLHISRYEAMLVPRIGAHPFLANRSYNHFGGPVKIIGSKKRGSDLVYLQETSYL